jgi:hypothetical protein
MSDAAESTGGQIEHLIFKCIRIQWPAMAENDWLPFTPILEIDLRTVLGGNGVHTCSL